jgi:ppGpp synthetase/RelA/SpoT-type nucleotidyltranferase
MALSSMQDVGGCRAVLDNLDELARVQGRLARSRPPIRTSDYITNPRPSGYRALHVVVNYDDLPIEVQLRTRVMHEWAIAVERLGGRLRCDLKGLVGPQPLLSFLESVSRALALEESGRLVSAELQKELRLRREEALPYLGGGAE